MTKLEEAARAMCRESYLDTAADAAADAPNANTVALAVAVERVVEKEWPKFLGKIRAVLRAIREPSEAMLRDDPETGVNLTGHLDAYSAETVWQIMIDRLLEERMT